ncbi:MAG: hypothetical protein QM692_17840 [Thermomicrobiales bacterium]
MDASQFDRLARTLADPLLRRQAVRTLAGALAGGVALTAGAATETAARKKKHRKSKKKRKTTTTTTPPPCRQPGEDCADATTCCQTGGMTVCRPFLNTQCTGVALTGNRCCGVEGTVCDPTFGTPLIPMSPNSHGNCSCCAELFCGEQLDGSFRCQTEPT